MVLSTLKKCRNSNKRDLTLFFLHRLEKKKFLTCQWMAYAFTRQAGPKGEPDKTHYGTFYGSLVFFVMVQKSGKKTRVSRASTLS